MAINPVDGNKSRFSDDFHAISEAASAIPGKQWKWLF
jgi:hypothetical protein